MRLSSIVDRLRLAGHDYALAIWTGAQRKWSSVPLQAFRVALARLVFHRGPRLYSMFRFDRKPVRTWRDYIDDADKRVQRSLNPATSRGLVSDKITFYRECLKHDLPTVKMLGAFYPRQGARAEDWLPSITDPASLQQLLDAHPEGLFMKPSRGSHGEGAFAVLPVSGGWTFPAGIGTAADLFEYCKSAAGADILLVQPRLVVHDALRPIMAGVGVGTVRAITYLRGGQPTLLVACLRITMEGSTVDNFHHGQSGNLLAPLDPISGAITVVRGSRTKAWPEVFETDEHPQSGVLLTGFRLPCWAELVNLILRGQKAFDALRTIGWDVAITASGPVLVEANSGYDFDLLQVAFDRGFALDLKQIAQQSSSAMRT